MIDPIKQGSTSVILEIFIEDASKTDGSGLAGLVFNSAGLKCAYRKQGTGNAGYTTVTLATATLGTWATGGFKEVDATNAPGKYELHLPDAAFSSGKWVDVYLFGATNMVPVMLRIRLSLFDIDDAVRAGLTALPNANAGANGGLPTGDASGRVTITPSSVQAVWDALTSALTTASSIGKALVQLVTDYTTARAAKLDNLDATISSRGTSTYAGGDTSGVTTLLARIPGTVQPQTGDSYARLGAPAGASVSADIAAAKSDTAAVVAKLPANSIADETLVIAATNTILTDTAAIKAKTTNLPASPAAVSDIPTAVQNADALLGRNIAGGSSTGRTVKSALAVLRNKVVRSGGTITVYDTDDTTVLFVATIVATPSTDPITSFDPP